MIRYLRGLNLPNKLTLLRILMIPVFFFFLLLPCIPGLEGAETAARLLAALFFLAASFTDMLDGKIARKYDLVTELGKFLDPIADKLMVFAAFFGLLCLEREDPVFTLLLSSGALLTLAREFAVTGLRTVKAGKAGKIIPANIFGKIKTVGQIVFVLCALLEPLFGFLLPAGPFLSLFTEYRCLSYTTMLFMTVMTVLSGVSYFAAYVREGKRVK